MAIQVAGNSIDFGQLLLIAFIVLNFIFIVAFFNGEDVIKNYSDTFFNEDANSLSCDSAQALGSLHNQNSGKKVIENTDNSILGIGTSLLVGASNAFFDILNFIASTAIQLFGFLLCFVHIFKFAIGVIILLIDAYYAMRFALLVNEFFF